MTQKTYNLVIWTIVLFAVLTPLIAWASNLGWELVDITAFQLFPLFGLLAWMVMWTHYSTWAIRANDSKLKKPKYYGGITGWFVLGALLLHPGILIYELWDIGLGLPPESYQAYVGEALKLAVLLGTISLIIFLSFEVFDRLREKEKVKKYWPVISISQSLAMILIFVHALKLGATVTTGWFQVVWIICGVILIPCLYLTHKQDFTKQ